MDGNRFNHLARSLIAPSRRGFSRALAGLGLAGGLATLPGLTDVAAKKKGKGKNKKKCAEAGGKAIKGKGKCCQGSARVCIGRCAFATVQDAVSQDKLRATITLCPGTYRERISIGQDVTLTGFGDGEGSGNTILESRGGNVEAVVTVAAGATANLQRLRIAGGSGFSVNGLINSGTARLTDCTISGHKSTSRNANGGGINNFGGTLSLTDCTVSGNASGTGGGIFNYGGAVSLNGCTISGNTSAIWGGGIWSDTKLVVTDSEISGNTAVASGGGIYSEDSLELVGCTVEGNRSQSDGGGIVTLAGTVKLDAASRVIGNMSEQRGGGIYNGGSTVTLANTQNVTNNTPNNCAGDAVLQCNG
jgi:predicted outer membrane repeat protein